MNNSLPAPIRSAIEGGNAILFLGAGASFDALLGGKEKRIPGTAVRDSLSDTFLNGAHKSRTLMNVADYARSEASLHKVQAHIKELFINLEPAEFHHLIPQFRWRAIVTTNYDLIIERAYANCENRLQSIAPVTKDGDELVNALSAQNSVPYLKLHGCIKNHADTNVPIVLDSAEYAKFKKGRENLVKTFTEWATQSPILFCGYSLGDENIKEILFDIGDASQHRDQYLYVDLEFDEIQTRYWMQRRIAPFQSSFKDFLAHIDAKIPTANRKLASLLSNDGLSISRWIPSHQRPSPSLTQYLQEELLHVQPSDSGSEAASPKAFYSGLDSGFSPIYSELDVRRGITDEILERAVLDTQPSTKPKLFLIKGYAGSGKSTLAKRVAVEASSLMDSPLVVWLKEDSIIRPELIIELQQLVKERLFVFIDDILEHSETFKGLIDTIFRLELQITVIGCSRTNELHIYGELPQSKITKEFELSDLEKTEVLQLLKKLAASKILGPLEQYSEADREIFVQKFYDQQLLVALHEITYGDSFENIVINEFEKLYPREAQQLYLDICTLHQCSVAVRAGLISRISGLPISELDKMLNGPLSKVIRANIDQKSRDMVYRSRHPEIARMVFALAIRDASVRADQLERMLSMMDLDYSSDKRAFFDLVRGKRLAELFEKKELALRVFDAAENTSASKGFLAHQRAVLELNHPNGNLDVALEQLKEAEQDNASRGYRDSSLQHTKANLLRKRALYARSTLERDRFRSDARGILKRQLGKRSNSYSEHLYGQLLLDEIREYFANGANKQTTEEGSLPDASIIRIITELNQLLDENIRRFPGDGPLTLLRSDFLKKIGHHPKAVAVLESFYKNNPTNSTVVRVLAEALSTNEGIDRGVEILKSCVLASPGDMASNLALAKLLMKQNEFQNAHSIISCLRRSFADGDTHYEARLLYARANLLHGDLSRGKSEFESLRNVYIDNKDKAIYPLESSQGVLKKFTGIVCSKDVGYGFISSPDLRFNSYLRPQNVLGDSWKRLEKGSSVLFSLAFNYKGAVAMNVELVED